MEMNDAEKMLRDAAVYGTGAMLDGKHIPHKDLYLDTDRELLELAAKAAGVDLARNEDGPLRDEFFGYFDLMRDDYWNPLTDDGDALRLAVKLQITVANEHVRAGVAYCTDGDDNVFPAIRSGANQGEVIEEDYAATRRAIVTAAAQLGKAIR